MTRPLLVFTVWTALLSAPSAVAAPPATKKDAKATGACPSEKVWSESQGGCVCGPGTTWDTSTRKCVVEANATRAKSEERKTKDRKATDTATKTAPEPKSPPPSAPIPSTQAPEPRDHNDARPASEDPRTPPPPPEEPAEPKARETRPTRDVQSERTCSAGARRSNDGRCPPPRACPAGTHRLGTGLCVSDAKTCAEGKEWKDAWGACVPACPPGQVLDFMGKACHTIKRISPR